MPDFKALDLDEALNMFPPIVELKVDGSRHSWKHGELSSDREIVRNDRFPHIAKELERLDAHVRGEIALPGLDSNVLQLNKRENWQHAKFFIFEVFSLKGRSVGNSNHADPVDQRAMVEQLFVNKRFRHLTLPMQFSSVASGWDYILRNNCEGLVLKGKGYRYKVKKLHEAKLPIVGYEKGKKGAFRINCNGEIGKVSATSAGFLQIYRDLKAAGKQPIAEVEYPFLTANGIPFQPRLRRIFA